MRSEIVTVRALAKQIPLARAISDEQLSLCGLMLGALYALSRAAELDYDDYRAMPVFADIAREFEQSAEAVARGEKVPDPWLAGFHFHSAIWRLDAVNTVLSPEVGKKPDKEAVLRLSVNSLKHDKGAHISGKNTVEFSHALSEAIRLCSLLQTWVG